MPMPHLSLPSRRIMKTPTSSQAARRRQSAVTARPMGRLIPNQERRPNFRSTFQEATTICVEPKCN